MEFLFEGERNEICFRCVHIQRVLTNSKTPARDLESSPNSPPVIKLLNIDIHGGHSLTPCEHQTLSSQPKPPFGSIKIFWLIFKVKLIINFYRIFHKINIFYQNTHKKTNK